MMIPDENKARNMKYFFCCILFLTLAMPWARADVVPQGFILIKENTFSPGIGCSDQNHPKVRIEDFEILDHAITKAEYGVFIRGRALDCMG